jgi:hypothetical protein
LAEDAVLYGFSQHVLFGTFHFIDLAHDDGSRQSAVIRRAIAPRLD